MTTGETLCDVASPIVLERMVFPEPRDFAGCGPQGRSTGKRWVSLWAVWLQKISLPRAYGRESGQTFPAWAELHLEIIVECHEAQVRRGTSQRGQASGGPRASARRWKKPKASFVPPVRW